jgi:hypothetical protein
MEARKYEIYLVERSTRNKELKYSDDNGFPKEEPRKYLSPGYYLQYVYDGKDTTSYHLPTECPHAWGYLYQRYTAIVLNYSSASLEHLPIYSDQFLANVKTEEETLEEEDWYFECYQCGSTIKLEINDNGEINFYSKEDKNGRV